MSESGIGIHFCRVLVDVLTGTVSCGLQLFRGSAELTNLTTSSNGLTVAHNGTVTAQNIAISNLGGVNTGALLTFEGLSYQNLVWVCLVLIQESGYRQQ